MVVYKKLTLKRLFQFNPFALIYIVVLCGITILFSLIFPHHDFISVPSLTIYGTVLAILIGFRINEAYNRYWEARILWGQLVNQSRNFARMVLSLINANILTREKAKEKEEIQRELIYRQLAYNNALRLHLRKQDNWEELKPFLNETEWESYLSMVNKPTQILNRQSQEIQSILNQEPGKDFRQIRFEETLNEFYNIQGGCERIKNTPFPRIYSRMTKGFTWIFATLLIISLYDEFDWQLLIIRGVVGYVYITLDKIQALLKNPFDYTIADTPMTSLCRTIEIDLRQMLGEKDIPGPIQPVDGILY
jgi:putative membrane protein